MLFQLASFGAALLGYVALSKLLAKQSVLSVGPITLI